MKSRGKISTLVIHIHGGGFVALSSSGHQSYLRKWAKLIPDAVIMSVDYRLAPEYVYPEPLDDVWQGYYWIINHCNSQLGQPFFCHVFLNPHTKQNNRNPPDNDNFGWRFSRRQFGNGSHFEMPAYWDSSPRWASFRLSCTKLVCETLHSVLADFYR